MKKELPIPVVVGILALVIVLGAGWGFMSMNNNGETKNPNVGKPNKKGIIGAMSQKEAENMTEDTYIKLLKQNRPDLTDSEIKQKADNWWHIRSSQTSN